MWKFKKNSTFWNVWKFKTMFENLKVKIIHLKWFESSKGQKVQTTLESLKVLHFITFKNVNVQNSVWKCEKLKRTPPFKR